MEIGIGAKVMKIGSDDKEIQGKITEDDGISHLVRWDGWEIAYPVSVIELRQYIWLAELTKERDELREELKQVKLDGQCSIGYS